MHTDVNPIILSDSMQTITEVSQFEQFTSTQARVVLFGGAHCGVCQALKPKVRRMMELKFPDVAWAYVDCEQYPAICAQHGIFSLPVMRLYMDAQLCLEMARSFSLIEFEAKMARIFDLWSGSR